MKFEAQAQRRKQTMTLHEFNLLDDSEKITLLYQNGVYIGKRKAGKRTLLLYQYQYFYVEVHYIKYRREIGCLHCFSSTLEIEPYLEQIPIEHIALPK